MKLGICKSLNLPFYLRLHTSPLSQVKIFYFSDFLLVNDLYSHIFHFLICYFHNCSYNFLYNFILLIKCQKISRTLKSQIMHSRMHKKVIVVLAKRNLNLSFMISLEVRWVKFLSMPSRDSGSMLFNRLALITNLAPIALRVILLLSVLSGELLIDNICIIMFH